MSNVRSRALGAPLDRALLDSAATPMRVFFGGFFLGWSWLSTVIILGGLLTPVAPGALLGVSDRYLIAFGIALLVSGAEFVSAGRWPGAYWLILLLCDASFTAWQTHTWLALIVTPHMTQPGTLTPSVEVAIWFVSIAGGIAAAIFGELLIFGKRGRD
jgi:hypothetical protein